MRRSEIRDYGFSEDAVNITDEQYVFGGLTNLPDEVVNESGQWDTPEYEPQAEKYETWGCTVWGAQNQTESYEKTLFGENKNYDERFNYLLAGVKEGGADPQRAYESIRDDGLIDDEPLPATYQEFTNKDFLTVERRNRGQDWKHGKDFHHEWVRDTSRKNLVERLKRSPQGIAVTAWATDDNGFYIDEGRPNTHWCEAYGHITEKMAKENLDELAEKYHAKKEAIYDYVVNKKLILLCAFDSYDHSHKLIHPDHRISVAKRIHIRKREPGETIDLTVFDILLRNGLIAYFVNWYMRFHNLMGRLLKL